MIYFIARQLLSVDNIKFVRHNDGSATAPMETMSPRRVYVTINENNKIKSIAYFDKSNKRYKQVDLDHSHYVDGKQTSPHTHMGYFHDENGTRELNTEEKKLLEKVKKEWYSHSNG